MVASRLVVGHMLWVDGRRGHRGGEGMPVSADDQRDWPERLRGRRRTWGCQGVGVRTQGVPGGKGDGWGPGCGQGGGPQEVSVQG